MRAAARVPGVGWFWLIWAGGWERCGATSVVFVSGPILVLLLLLQDYSTEQNFSDGSSQRLSSLAHCCVLRKKRYQKDDRK